MVRMILSSSFEKCENHSRNETHLLLSDNLVSIAREEERELKRNPSVPAKESEVPLPLKETETSFHSWKGAVIRICWTGCVYAYINDSFFFFSSWDGLSLLWNYSYLQMSYIKRQIFLPIFKKSPPVRQCFPFTAPEFNFLIWERLKSLSIFKEWIC